MGKKLLVWLHGFGFDKNNNHEFAVALAQKYDAELFTLDAPYPSGRERGGYAWFDIGVFDEKVDLSAGFIIDEINKLGVDWSDVILSGRSQGACMAMYIALSGKAMPHKIISVCGRYPDELLERGIKNTDTEIIWVEGLNDTVIPADRKDSYKNLQKAGCKVEYILNDKSDHDNLDLSILDQI